MSDLILASVVGVVGTLAGSLVGAWTQREAKKIGVLERKVERYREEIRTRQAEEEVAAEWLFEHGESISQLGAKRALRRRTLERRGVSPRIGPNEVGPS